MVSGFSHDGLGSAGWDHGSIDGVKKDKLGLMQAKEIGERVAKTVQLVKIGIEQTGIK